MSHGAGLFADSVQSVDVRGRVQPAQGDLHLLLCLPHLVLLHGGVDLRLHRDVVESVRYEQRTVPARQQEVELFLVLIRHRVPSVDLANPRYAFQCFRILLFPYYILALRELLLPGCGEVRLVLLLDSGAPPHVLVNFDGAA